MSKQNTLIKAMQLGISLSEARYTRLKYIEERIQLIEPVCIGLQKIKELDLQEPSLDLWIMQVEYRDILSEYKHLLAERTQWTSSKPTRLTANMIDWEAVRAYPCTALMAKPPVKKSGKEWIYYAPHHGSNSPSFKIDPAKNLWHDFKTGEGGDSVKLYRLLYGGTVREAGLAISKLI